MKDLSNLKKKNFISWCLLQRAGSTHWWSDIRALILVKCLSPSPAGIRWRRQIDRTIWTAVCVLRSQGNFREQNGFCNKLLNCAENYILYAGLQARGAIPVKISHKLWMPYSTQTTPIHHQDLLPLYCPHLPYHIALAAESFTMYHILSFIK